MMTDGVAHAPLRVLVVEDSEDDAFFLLRELRNGGYEPIHERVDTLADIGTALELKIWDLLICDYNLPGFSALDVLRLVQAHNLDLPVIIVSGAIGEDLAVEAMHAGAHDYIMKDNLVRLNPAVRRELQEMEIHRERKQAEAALKESEQRFRQLTENIREVFWLIDCAHWRMIYVSPAFEQVWEYPSRTLMNNLSALLDTIHPEDYSRVEAMLKRHGWTGLNDDYRIVLPDGRERWISTRSFPIRDAEGRVYRVAGLSIDITERKRLEGEMKKMSRALEQTADAVMITDAEGHIEYVNPAFEDTTGYGRSEVLGKMPSLLKSGLQDRATYRQLWQNLQRGLPYSEIFINRRKDGDLYYESKTITPVRDSQGDITHFVSTGKDITERLRAQERLQKIAHYDAVTGLANRILFTDRLSQALMNARRLESRLAVLSVGFPILELLGEGADELVERVLRMVARRLKEVMPGSALVAQQGQEEFLILEREIRDEIEIDDMAQALIEAFAQPLVADGYELYLSPSIGISVYPDDGQRTEELMANAARALEQARTRGAGICRYGSDDVEGLKRDGLSG